MEEGVGLAWEFEFRLVPMLPDIFKIKKPRTKIMSAKKAPVVSAPITKYLKRLGVAGRLFSNLDNLVTFQLTMLKANEMFRCWKGRELRNSNGLGLAGGFIIGRREEGS